MKIALVCVPLLILAILRKKQIIPDKYANGLIGIVVIVGAILMLCIGKWLGFYSLELAVEATDANTITLLFGMMVVVGLFQATGFFEYLAVFAAKLARGKPWLLFIYLGLTSSDSP